MAQSVAGSRCIAIERPKYTIPTTLGYSCVEIDGRQLRCFVNEGVVPISFNETERKTINITCIPPTLTQLQRARLGEVDLATAASTFSQYLPQLKRGRP